MPLCCVPSSNFDIQPILSPNNGFNQSDKQSCLFLWFLLNSGKKILFYYLFISLVAGSLESEESSQGDNYSITVAQYAGKELS